LRLVVILAMALLSALTRLKLKWRGIQKETRFA
jgi:hypothetical protein